MKSIKNIIKVIMSNFSTVLAGILVSFLLPKIISKPDYGFYKIFTLYFSYLGVLSLGIIDGIVLKYGNKNLDELEKEKFRTIFSIYVLIHIAFVFIIIITSLFFDTDYKFILLMLGAILLPVNIIGYFQQISQITQRFKEYSIRKIIQSIMNVLYLGVLFLLYYFADYIINYKIYVYGVIGINVFLCLWYIYTYRKIIFGKRIPFRLCGKEILYLMKIGLPLLVANLCSTLLLSLDRQFVSILFSTEEYASYAFAYSMMTLVTTATSSIAIVIYPMFKRMDQDYLCQNYRLISAPLLSFVFLVCLIYNPLCYVIEGFLPAYIDSLLIFRIILPGVAISANITVIIHNYYKVLGKSFSFFIISMIELAISFVFNIAAYLIFKTMSSISIASIISMFIWYVTCEMCLRKYCKLSIKNYIYLALMFALFYLSTMIDTHWLSLIIHFFGYFAITIAIYFTDIKKIYNLVTNKKITVESSTSCEDDNNVENA